MDSLIDWERLVGCLIERDGWMDRWMRASVIQPYFYGYATGVLFESGMNEWVHTHLDDFTVVNGWITDGLMDGWMRGWVGGWEGRFIDLQQSSDWLVHRFGVIGWWMLLRSSRKPGCRMGVLFEMGYCEWCGFIHWLIDERVDWIHSSIVKIVVTFIDWEWLGGEWLILLPGWRQGLVGWLVAGRFEWIHWLTDGWVAWYVIHCCASACCLAVVWWYTHVFFFRWRVMSLEMKPTENSEKIRRTFGRRSFFLFLFFLDFFVFCFSFF